MRKIARKAIAKLRHYAGHCWATLYELRHARDGCELIPQLTDYERLIREPSMKLKPYYLEYISKVSPSDMAVSFRLSVLLWTLMDVLEPRLILDLGSGFSSFLFRLHAAHAARGAVVYSVDSDDEWLGNTRVFLERHHLNTENLFHWPDFCGMNHLKFDLILHDLDDMEMRGDTLPYVLSLAHERSFIILDDMHKWWYKRRAIREVDKSGYELYSLRNYTLDDIKRFSYIAVRQQKEGVPLPALVSIS